MQSPIELPFGSRVTYDVEGLNGELVGDDLTLTVIPKGDEVATP